MDKNVRTQPTEVLSLSEYVAIEKPKCFLTLTDEQISLYFANIERHSLALATKLGIGSKSGRMPAFIWMIGIERAAEDNRSTGRS